MNTDFNIERQLTAWLDSTAAPRAPEDVLTGALARTSRMRPRPAWAFIERWIPMQLTMRRWTFPRSLTYILVVLGLALLLALSAFLVVGALHRLPGPFGLAKPGLIAYDDGGHIFAKNVDGTSATQITNGATFDFNPSWSSDGTSLVYWSAVNPLPDESTTNASLMYMSQVGGQAGASPVELASGVSVAIYGPPLQLSPDGKLVAFVSDTGAATAVTVLDVRSGETLKTIPNAVSPAWSPDSSQLAYSTNEAQISPGVWVANTDGTNAHLVSEGLSSVGQGSPSGIPWEFGGSLGAPAWSPNGKELAFTGGAFTRRLFLVDADGTNLRELAAGPGGADNAVWSPTGTRIGFVWKVDPTNPSSDLNIGFINADGTNPVDLHHASVGFTVTWAPDESRLLGYETFPTTSGTVLLALDPNQILPSQELPIGDNVGEVSWQRLGY